MRKGQYDFEVKADQWLLLAIPVVLSILFCVGYTIVNIIK